MTQDWNSKLSNSSYDVKRQKLAGHGLLLNQTYFREQPPAAWNSQSIRKRAQWLMAKITQIWPQLSETAGSWYEKPKAVVILDEVYPVYSWRDVVRRTAEVAVQWCGENFEEQVVTKRPSYFTRKPSGDAWYQLPNDWWVYVNLSADAVKEISAAIVEAAGIPEDEYDVELW